MTNTEHIRNCKKNTDAHLISFFVLSISRELFLQFYNIWMVTIEK